ncbi:MAG: hypothetical protein ACRBBP_03720 [Bdellovibrionales bacterium]
MKITILCAIIFFSIFSYGSGKTWDELSLSDQADILYNLDYFSPDDELKGVQVINLLTEGEFIAEEVSEEYRAVAKIALETFDDEVSRESIEQSPYSTYGDEEVIEFYLLTDVSGKILGGTVSFYQDGRDQDGEDSDVNWSATMRLDADGKPFKDENGYSVDEMRFEWSGH